MAVKLKIVKKRKAAAQIKSANSDQSSARIEREKLVRRLRQEYTPSVCARTLQVNEEFPILLTQ